MLAPKLLIRKLSTIQESINCLLASPCAKQVERTQNVHFESNRPSWEARREENSTCSCNGTAPTTKPQDIRLDEDNNEIDWTRVDYRKNGSKSWRQKANILRGTAKCESEMLSADIHLVVYRLGKHVTSLQLSRFIESKDIQILGCDLLTKHEGAR